MNNIYTNTSTDISKDRKPALGDAFTTWRGAIKRKFGITPETYYQLSESQNHLCAICKKTDSRGAKLSVDHCHTSKKVRGLLCRHCNVALGYLNDDISLLESAIKYLEKSQEEAGIAPASNN